MGCDRYLGAHQRQLSRQESIGVHYKFHHGRVAARVLKNALVKYGSGSEGVARACIGCLCALAVNSIPTQKLISDLALPHVMLLTLGKHSSISFRGRVILFREWLRDNAARKDEVDSSAGAHRKYD